MQNRYIPAVQQLQRQYDLLRTEYEAEKETYQAQTEQVGIVKKIRQGVCWYPVSLSRSYYNSLNQLVVEVGRKEDQDVEHNFEYGRPVRFFVSDSGGRLRYFNFTSVVSYAEENRMVVSLPSSAALTELMGRPDLGIQLYFDETSYQTMFAALQEVIQAKGNRLAYLRAVFYGVPAQTLKLFPVRFPWLNPSQEEAVNKVLAAKDVVVVHGPPGTGKTTTLVEAIYETLHRENQVLVCAQSNTAVDWISEKLLDRGIPVLRIGNPTRVNDKMLSFTYERRFESHPDYPELWGIRKAIREIHAALRGNGQSRKDTLRNRLSKLKLRETELVLKIDSALFSEARVVSCTLVGSANRLMTNLQFSTLFIDEAAQALEAACWIAIRKAERVVFAGDHQQLPPTVKSPEALRGGLGYTLMERIVQTNPDVVSVLKIQYRMHWDIMGFSSRWFYNNELLAAPEVSYRNILDWDTPLVWLDTDGFDCSEEVRGDTMSRINRREAELLVLQLQVYIENVGKERILEENIDFGLISPYKVQVQYIRSLVRKNAFLKPFRRLVSVHTVDGFQGQERDVILISLVRANEEGHIGFLNDLRRMNVAMTRARMKLVILGDSSTLVRHRFYRELYRYVSERGKVVALKEIINEKAVSGTAGN